VESPLFLSFCETHEKSAALSLGEFSLEIPLAIFRVALVEFPAFQDFFRLCSFRSVHPLLTRTSLGPMV